MQSPRHYECRYLLSHGKEYCTVDCPICSGAKSLYRTKSNLTKDSFEGSSPTVFVGRFGYPNVSMGVMAPPELREDAWFMDAPKDWAIQNLQIPALVDLRSSLVNSRFTTNIKGSGKNVALGQEVAMAERSVDVDIELSKRPVFRLNFRPDLAPSGPNAELKKISLTSNPKVPLHVEKAYSDIDYKAGEAVTDLYARGYNENYLSGLLSAGVLGVRTQRKLVPTRWSITATDDAIAKMLRDEIDGLSEIGYFVWSGGYLGNNFLVMSFPGVWRYELFELYVDPKSPISSDKVPFTTDYEDYVGRKAYVTETAGGYYASRLAVLEQLKAIKRKGSILVFRFITDEYSVPLGVWVVREAVRKAMRSKPIEFGSQELMMRYVLQISKRRYGYEAGILCKRSKVLKLIRQKKISDYF